MVAKRSSNQKMTPIAETLAKLLQQYRPVDDPFMVKIWSVWEDAVGSSIAANAQPVAFKGDMLLVRVSSSTWLHHLRILESEMLEKINQAIGQGCVRAIKWKVGTL